MIDLNYLIGYEQAKLMILLYICGGGDGGGGDGGIILNELVFNGPDQQRVEFRIYNIALALKSDE